MSSSWGPDFARSFSFKGRHQKQGDAAGRFLPNGRGHGIIAPVKSIVLSTVALLAGCSRPSPAPEKPAAAEAASSAKITQFYASPPVMPKGDKALLCYGVEGAKAVRVDPPVEKLAPALTRCFEVKPEKTTSYTLIAEDARGAAVKQTVEVTVGGASPRLYDISINAKSIKRGQQISFCYKAANAVRVSGGPGKFFMKGNPQKDCLVDKPQKTTTYEIVIANKEGITDSASITVEVTP